MFLSFGLVVDAILLVLGVLWLREMSGRWRSDFAEIRTTDDASTKQVLILLWVATAVIALVLLNFVAGLVLAFF